MYGTTYEKYCSFVCFRPSNQTIIIWEMSSKWLPPPPPTYPINRLYHRMFGNPFTIFNRMRWLLLLFICSSWCFRRCSSHCVSSSNAMKSHEYYMDCGFSYCFSLLYALLFTHFPLRLYLSPTKFADEREKKWHFLPRIVRIKYDKPRTTARWLPWNMRTASRINRIKCFEKINQTKILYETHEILYRLREELAMLCMVSYSM